MNVTIKFTIREKDCFNKDIVENEKKRIIKSVMRNLKNQWNVNTIYEPVIKK